MAQQPSVSAYAGAGVFLVRENGDVLMLERNPDYKNNGKRAHEIEAPGGKIAPGETPEQAAIRECYEETGEVLLLNSDQLSDENRVESATTVFWVVKLTAQQADHLDTRVAAALAHDITRNGVQTVESLSAHWVPPAAVCSGKWFQLPLRKFNVFMVTAAQKKGFFSH